MSSYEERGGDFLSQGSIFNAICCLKFQAKNHGIQTFAACAAIPSGVATFFRTTASSSSALELITGTALTVAVALIGYALTLFSGSLIVLIFGRSPNRVGSNPFS